MISHRFFHAVCLVGTVALSVLFSSCLPRVSVTSGAGDEATIFFSTGFSADTAKTLRAIGGIDENTPLFSKTDILALLKAAGAENTSVTIPTATELAASGRIKKLSQNSLSKTGILKKAEKSLVLTVGPKQIRAFYELLDDDTKSYLDLMMIPALIGETMTASEYRELLSSMYGPSFANEIVDGKLTINISSADGKKMTQNTLSLGELLTAQGEIEFSL